MTARTLHLVATAAAPTKPLRLVGTLQLRPLGMHCACITLDNGQVLRLHGLSPAQEAALPPERARVALTIEVAAP